MDTRFRGNDESGRDFQGKSRKVMKPWHKLRGRLTAGLGTSRLRKKGVVAALRRQRVLNPLEIWRDKPAATSFRLSFSAAC